MRVVGIDLGSRRIGVAVSDPTGTIATPHEVVQRSGDERRDHAAIGALVRELDAERVVVGLPLSMNGRKGPAARAAEEEATTLAEVLGIPVELFDERLTTVTANRSLQARGMKAPARRKVVDGVAAATILQHWLDARR